MLAAANHARFLPLRARAEPRAAPRGRHAARVFARATPRRRATAAARAARRPIATADLEDGWGRLRKDGIDRLERLLDA